MKHSVSVLIGASSLFLGCTKAFNFDDQERMLQRARDMNDSTPMTEDEAKRLRSMLDRGLLKIVDKPSNRVSEAKADKNSIPRALKSSKSERHKKNIDIPRGSGARTSTARGKKPERGERKAPTDAKRSKTEKVSHRKKDTDSLGTESSPKASRNKPKKGGRHDESYNYEIA